jgi:hypothetical protein
MMNQLNMYVLSLNGHFCFVSALYETSINTL